MARRRIKSDVQAIVPVRTQEERLSFSTIVSESNAYETDSAFKPWDGSDFRKVRTTFDMIRALESDKNSQIDARILCKNSKGKWVYVHMDKDTFLETWKKDPAQGLKVKESSFDTDGYGYDSVGQDFTPLLGGPFYKQLYFFQDYIRQHAQSFYAYHHDPFAKAIVSITRDFVLGTGWDVQPVAEGELGDRQKVVWKAFFEANDLEQMIDDLCVELAIYGEVMLWKLPNNEAGIRFGVSDDLKPHGMIPRVRLIDPSNIIEIVTKPEDISARLFYTWMAPTQYQIMTHAKDGSSNEPSSKFIYQQIPAQQMMHYAVNKVSNEKRGRSDLFPVLGHLKRLRDTVDYAITALNKQAAWAIDTKIEGSAADIDRYIAAQKAIGSIPPAGSEFVHSAKIERNMVSPEGAARGNSVAFDWTLSMIAAGVQIPVSYFGTHLSGGQTRASAIVSTEPVAKKFEKRRDVMRRIISDLWNYCMSQAGLNGECRVIFPELITQDRTAKLKDLQLAVDMGWINKRKAAEIAAKELGITDYNFDKDSGESVTESPQSNPLTAPPLLNSLTGQQRAEIKKQDVKL